MDILLHVLPKKTVYWLRICFFFCCNWSAEATPERQTALIKRLIGGDLGRWIIWPDVDIWNIHIVQCFTIALPCLCLSVWLVITVWLTLLRGKVFMSWDKTHLLAVMRCVAVRGLACVWICWNVLTETLCPVAFLQNCMLIMWLPVLSMLCCVSNLIKLNFLF